MKRIIKGGISVAIIKDGSDGTSVTISGSTTRYAVTTTSTKPADSAFTLTSIPTPQQGKYIWSMTVVTFSVGDPIKFYTVARTGTDGKDGTDSYQIDSVVNQYAVTNSSSTTPGDDDWSTTEPALELGQYLWKRQIVYFTNGTSKTTTPVCDYLASVMQKGETIVKGGLLMTGIVAVKNSEGIVTAYLNGFGEHSPDGVTGRPFLAGGVKNFGTASGTDKEDYVTALYPNGAAKLGVVYIIANNGSVGDTVAIRDGETERVLLTINEIETLDTLMQQSGQNESEKFSGSYTDTQLENGVSECNSSRLEVKADGTTIKVSGSVTLTCEAQSAPSGFAYSWMEISLYRSDTATSSTVTYLGNIVYVLTDADSAYTTKSYSQIFYNMKKGFYGVQIRCGFANPSSDSTLFYKYASYSATMLATKVINNRAVKIGQNGISAFFNKDKFFHVDNSDDTTLKVDSMELGGKWDTDSSSRIGSGLGMPILWCAYVSSDGNILKQWGKGVTADNKGGCERTGDGSYTITLPSGLVTDTYYGVMAQSYMATDDCRYCLVYAKTKTTFKIKAYTGNNYRDTYFFLIMFGMTGWI